MKLSFLKIDRILQTETGERIEIPAGGIRFDHKEKEISLSEPLELHVVNGEFVNQMRFVCWDVYGDQTLIPQEMRMQWSLVSLLANDEVLTAIREQMGLLPVYTVAYEKLFEREMAVV